MQLVITNAGIAAARAAEDGGYKINITAFKVGAGFNYNPTPADTALRGAILHTGAPVSIIIENLDTAVYNLRMDDTIGDFLYGELGLYLEDGTLFGIAAFSTLQEKRKSGAGVAGNIIAFETKIRLASIAAVLEFTTVNNVNLPFISGVHLLSLPSEASSNAYLTANRTHNGGSVVAVQSSDDIWAFGSHPVRFVVSTVQAGSSTTSLVSNAIGTIADFVVGKYLIQFTSGPRKGQVRQISSVSANTVRWLEALAAAPASGDSFEILRAIGGAATREVGTTAGNVLEVGTAGLAGIAPILPDYNTISPSGFYRLAGTAANRPADATTNLLNMQFSSGGQSQLAIGITDGSLWSRANNGAWKAIYRFGEVSYTDLQNIPTSFNPSPHTHSASQITSGVFDTARMANGTTGAGRTIRIDTNGQPQWAQLNYSDLANIPTSFNPSPHQHAASDIISGILAPARLAVNNPTDGMVPRYNATAGAVQWNLPAWNDISGKPSTYAPSPHDHTYAQVVAWLGFPPVQQGTGIGQSTNIIKIGYAGNSKTKLTVDATDFGAIALESWVVSGFSLLGHQHNISDVLDLQNQLNQRALRNNDVTFRDITANRGDGTGALWLGNGGNRYLYYDNSRYYMPGSKLVVDGGLETANWCVAYGMRTTSDSRKKTGFKNLVGSREILRQLQGESYRMIDTGEAREGFVAQKVQRLIPRAVFQNDDGFLSLDPFPFIAHLVEGYKGVDEDVESMKLQLQSQAREIEELKRMVQQILQRG